MAKRYRVWVGVDEDGEPYLETSPRRIEAYTNGKTARVLFGEDARRATLILEPKPKRRKKNA